MDSINVLQGVAAHHNLYSDNSVEESYISDLVSRSACLRRVSKARVTEHTLVGDGHGSLVMSRKDGVQCLLDLSCVFILRKAAKYILGGKAVHVRNPELYELVCRDTD